MGSIVALAIDDARKARMVRRAPRGTNLASRIEQASDWHWWLPIIYGVLLTFPFVGVCRLPAAPCLALWLQYSGACGEVTLES